MRKIQIYLFFIITIILISFYEQDTIAANSSQTNIIGSVIKLDEVDLGNQTYQLLITTEGYYLINSTEIVSFYKNTDQFKEYIISPDINDDGYNEIVFITNNTLSSNMKTIDIYNSELIWDYTPIRIGKDLLGQHVEVQAPIIDCEITNDSIYIVYDYKIEKLNLVTGENIWTHEEDDNIWSISSIKDINNDGYNDIVYSKQPTYIKAISSYDHQLIWEKQVSKSYDIVENDKINDTVETNIWQVETDSMSNIYAAGEDGYIYKLDSNGNLINEIEILEIPKGYYNKHYNKTAPKPTGLYNGTYQNVRFNLIENNNVLFIQYYLNFPLNKQSNNNSNNSGPSPSFGIIDFNSDLKKLWGEDINFSSKLQYSLGSENNYYLLIENVSDGIQINYYDIISNLLENNKTLNIQLNNINVFGNTPVYFSVSEDTVYFISNNSDLHIYDTVTKEINSISRIEQQISKPLDEKINLTFDIKSSTNEYNRPTKYIYSGIKATNSETNETIWDYNIDSTYKALGGFSTYHIIKDINDDSTKDILLFLTKNNNDQNIDINNIDIPKIITISGEDGSIIYENSLTYPSEITDNNNPEFLKNNLSSPLKNSFLYVDITGDGIEEYLFMNSHFDIFIYDIKLGKTERFLSGSYYDLNGNEDIYKVENSEMGEPTPYILPDNNKDGYPELLLVDWGKISIFNSSVSDKLYFTESEVILTSEYISTNNIDIQSFTRINDLNGDGVDDFSFYESDGTTNKDGYSNYKLTIFSGLNASKLYSLPTNQAIIYPSNYDINNNGTNDYFSYSGWNDEEKSRGYFLFDGQTGEILFSEYNDHWNDYIDPLINKQALRPFTISSDITGDGNPDILGIKNLAWDSGVVVQIYDIDTSEIIDQIIFDRPRYQNDDFLEWSYGQHISYHEVSGNKYLLSTALYNNENDLQTVFYNLTNQTREFVIQDIIVDLIEVNDNYIEYINLNNKQKRLSLLSNLEFTNITNGATIDKQSIIKWSSSLENVLYTVYVDNTKVSTTYNKEFPVILESGEHSITISQLDSNGMILFKTINVNVVKDNTSIFYLFGLILFAGILVFLSPIKWRNYNRAVINDE